MMQTRSSLYRYVMVVILTSMLLLTNSLSVLAQQVYPYLTYLPKHQPTSTTSKMPLIIYLHGSSQRGNNLAQLKTYGMPKYLEQGGKVNAIVIAPQCPSGMLWDSEDWLPKLLKEVKGKYSIDTSRIYLTGVSMGGGGTFEIAKKYPHLFAAIAPLCAWQSSTKDLCKLKALPIWTLHGENDNVVPIQQTEAKIAVLKKCHPNVTYTRLANEGHSIHWIYEQPEQYNLYEWLLKHSKLTNKF